MPGRDYAHAQDDLNQHILRMLEGTFSLDPARVPRAHPAMISY